MLFKVFVLFFLVFIYNCVPLKQEVSENDLRKLVERFAYIRFHSRLEVEDIAEIQSDRKIFLDVCKVYRLNPELVIEKLKTTHPKLYQRLTLNEK
jgi:hypothetical protein